MTPEEQIAHDAEVEKQLRDLATQIAAMTKLGFDPMTIRKGIIASVSDATSPPTVSLNISGDVGTLVSEVRLLNNYTPLVGQTVLLAKQGTEIFLLGSIASDNPHVAAQSSESGNGWTTLSPSSGSGGSGDNAIRYRRVMDHGSWKMQWRGEWNPGGADTMIGSSDALTADFRPGGRRALAAARDASGATTLRMEFSSDGTARLWQSAPTINTTGDIGTSTGGGGYHSHGYDDNYGPIGEFISSDSTYGAGDHSHAGYTTSHNHGGTTQIAAPAWISLNGLEYFL